MHAIVQKKVSLLITVKVNVDMISGTMENFLLCLGWQSPGLKGRCSLLLPYVLVADTQIIESLYFLSDVAAYQQTRAV